MRIEAANPIRCLLTALCLLLAVSSMCMANDEGHRAVSEAALATQTSRGSASATITILVFSDFESFTCARTASVLAGLLKDNDDIRIIFKHAPAYTNPNSFLAHEAALAAAAQGKFWEMHNLLFGHQTKLGRVDLLDYAKHLGLDAARFQQALDNHTYRSIIERDLAEAKALGVTTTPTLFVNGRRLVGPQGYASLGAVIDSLPAGMPQDRRVQKEIVAVGPAQAINLDHANTIGLSTAPLSLVEFSDFECPVCAQVAPVLQQLAAAYPTRIRFSFKHYPLPMHQNAALAHEAALAAGDQGKFWEMHDLLFVDQDNLKRDDLIAKAEKLKLDMHRFVTDLDSHRFKSVVDADRQEGSRLGVDGTPFFFLNGHAMSGGVGLNDFKSVIDAVLNETQEVQTKQ
jgi:protein-disulfide isomerase